ncbi:hypothetical protein M422DRAFT_239184 [Sphaerobolus stellatus SS14]|nr:hypothetical protein M422DRAFT_239184 [Sphaerobolus stellatus SS14]
MATMKYPWNILKDPNANWILNYLNKLMDLKFIYNKCEFRHDILFHLNPEEWLNNEIITGVNMSPSMDPPGSKTADTCLI